MTSNTRHLMLRLPRLLSLAAVVGAIMAWLAVGPIAQSQGIPPLCAAVGEPGTNPCGTVGVSCRTETCTGGPDGVIPWYCCYEVRRPDGVIFCREWSGTWRCCNGKWQPNCRRNNEDDQELNCERTGSSAGQCFG
jgi:hypothetical protein